MWQERRGDTVLGSKPGRWVQSPDCSWDAEIPPPRVEEEQAPPCSGGAADSSFAGDAKITFKPPILLSRISFYFFLPLLLGVKYLGRLLQVSHRS